MTDKRIIHIFSVSVMAVLLLLLLLPFGESGRIAAAIFLLPVSVLIFVLLKKRNILSINKNQVLLVVTVAALVFVMIYYLTGLKFGFYKNPYKLSVGNFFKYVLPIATVIVSTEIIRLVMMAQNSKFARVTCYFSCVIAEMLICSNLPHVTSFNRFMDLMAGALFPALISNYLYNYLSEKYGMYPNVSFRLIITLHSYIFAITSKISDSLVNLFNLFIPIALYLFIAYLYDNKVKKRALPKASRIWRMVSRVAAAFVAVFMIGTVMLMSNHFQYGALVVASESMAGTFNKGDMVIFEDYDDQPIEVGQVIVYENNNSVIIHRVVDIKIIDGTTRYYTKGDANEDKDLGYITDSDITGVANFKLPAVGYPTLWLRSLFSY